MQKKENNYAFIDGQNLHLGIKEQDWILDYRKFRIYLKEKYAVTKAYYFIGYIPENKKIYTFLKNSDFEVIFKKALKYNKTFKGNCDAELVLYAAVNINNYEKAVVVTGDGDFACLIEYLKNHNKLRSLIIPNDKKYSTLLKMTAWKHLTYLEYDKEKLAYKKMRGKQ